MQVRPYCITPRKTFPQKKKKSVYSTHSHSQAHCKWHIQRSLLQFEGHIGLKQPKQTNSSKEGDNFLDVVTQDIHTRLRRERLQ
jgi:hypothetical protein